jgi:hypothetical protein
MKEPLPLAKQMTKTTSSPKLVNSMEKTPQMTGLIHLRTKNLTLSLWTRINLLLATKAIQIS